MADDKQSNKSRFDSYELSDGDYEKIGRALEMIVVTGYHSTRRLFIFNLLRGMFFGIGSALGATVIIVILVWLFNLLGEVPLIGDLFDSAQDTVERVNN